MRGGFKSLLFFLDLVAVFWYNQTGDIFMNNTDVVENKENSKVKLNKKSKAVIIILSVVAVVGIVISLCVLNKTAITTKLTYAFMPKVIDMSEYDSSLDLVLYVEKNDEFNAKKDAKEPLKACKYYYYDENGEKVTLNYDDPIFVGTDNEGMVCIPFYLEATKGLNSLVTGIKITAVVIGVLIVIGAIILWFILWSKKYDREKAAYNQKVNSSGKNKKKKRNKK